MVSESMAQNLYNLTTAISIVMSIAVLLQLIGSAISPGQQDVLATFLSDTISKYTSEIFSELFSFI